MSTFIRANSVTPAFLILSCLRARAELSVLHLQEKEREVRIVLNYMCRLQRESPGKRATREQHIKKSTLNLPEGA